MATRTSSHVTSVLHIDAFSLAAMSAALVSGRVPRNGGTPWESRAWGFALLTVAATKPAMKGGVSSTLKSVSQVRAGGSWRNRKNNPTSNGSSMPTSPGRDWPC